jgi:hypothetical protein
VNKLLRKIDADGLFVEDVFFDTDQPIPADLIDSPTPGGFIRPKWLNGAWVEGGYATVEQAREALKQRVAAKRWKVETGGTIVNGVPVVTDMTSQAKLTGALNFVGRKPGRVIQWKAANGTFVSMTKTMIEALADGAGEFVASCFDAEAAHCAAIDLLPDVAAALAYDINTGWPA